MQFSNSGKMKMKKEITPEIIKAIRENRELVLEKDCDYLLAFMEREWSHLRATDQLALLEIMLKEKQCKSDQLLPFLYKLMEDPDPLYRYHAINFIVEIDGQTQREFLIRVIEKDLDYDNRKRALILLSNLFEAQRDKDILKLAIALYDNPASSVGVRLTAGAAMMFQLGITSDEDGRPAFWGDDEEELNHPAIQRAAAETREILTKDA